MRGGRSSGPPVTPMMKRHNSQIPDAQDEISRPKRNCAPQNLTEPLIPPDNEKDHDWRPETGDISILRIKGRSAKPPTKGMSSISTRSPFTTSKEGTPTSSVPLTPPSDPDDSFPTTDLKARKRKHSDASDVTVSASKRQEIDLREDAPYHLQRSSRDHDENQLIEVKVRCITWLPIATCVRC